jgi:transketolase
VIGIEPLVDKWAAFGWETHEVDGHDVAALLAVLRTLAERDGRARPAVVIAHTVKGKGVSFMESELGWHLGYLAEEDEARALAEVRGEA